MTSEQISNTTNEILEHLSNGRIKFALDKSALLCAELQIGEYTDELNEISTNYRYLLDYFFLGVEDPERKTIQNKLTARLYSLVHLLNEELLMRNSSSFEYGQKRIFRHKLHFSQAGDMMDSIHYSHSQFELLKKQLPGSANDLKRIRANYEQLIPDVFLIFWLSTKFGNPEKKLFNDILALKAASSPEKSIMISALTLNLWRMFDPEKIQLLFDACSHEDLQVSQRALVGLCFILHKYNSEFSYFPKLRNRLVLMTDNSQISEQLKNILFIIIGTSDTDKITKKMTEEILPEMMKISPKLKDKLGEQNLAQPEEWEEENPEWRDILEESGLAEKMQELTELQLEGADVYMSTFSILKNFPFFNEISNWFMPFDPELSLVNELFNENEKTIASAFVKNSAICNSDKYSFCLSLMQMPGIQRENLTKSFKVESDQIDELTKDEMLLSPSVFAKNTAKQYIQDLFRFFRLNPHHRDFKSIFDNSLDLHNSNFFQILAATGNIKSEIAEFYFVKNHFPQAIELFSELTKRPDVSASYYQKLGFAYQNMQQIASALSAYEKADIIQPDDAWTLRKMAICYKLTGEYQKALHTYQHLDFLKPGKNSTLLQIANCYAKLEKYEEALKLYFELDSMEDGQVKLWRLMSLASVYSGKFTQAQYFTDKVISEDPSTDDMILAGFIYLVLNQKEKSLQHFKNALEYFDNDLSLYAERIVLDEKLIQSLGLSEQEIGYIIDKLSFDIDNNR